MYPSSFQHLVVLAWSAKASGANMLAANIAQNTQHEWKQSSLIIIQSILISILLQ